MEIICPSFVNTAFELLQKSGFKAYAVGGCVRDSIMGRVPNDWDMTTSARPEQTQEIFRDYKTIPTGIKHGTVTVIIDGQPLEITTMRVDGEYTDNRRPDSVEYTDEITMDLSRRDFTVNAMAYNPDEGIIDPFGGTEDIERKIIRCVGNPDKRFGEDALRIIRALRFASVLEFDIDKETSESILKNHSLMQNVANERIRTELLKLLTGKNVAKILSEYKTVIFGIIPELEAEDGFLQHSPYHIYDVWTHTVKVVEAMKNEPILKMAALLHDVSKPECFEMDDDGVGHFYEHVEKGAQKSEKIMRRLRFSNADINTVYNIIILHESRPDGTKRQLMRLCSEYSITDVRNMLHMMIADGEGKNPELTANQKESFLKAQKQLGEIEKENPCLKISDLDIDGEDLIRIGINGKEIRNTLDKLLNMVIDGKISNQKSELIEQAKKIKNK